MIKTEDLCTDRFIHLSLQISSVNLLLWTLFWKITPLTATERNNHLSLINQINETVFVTLAHFLVASSWLTLGLCSPLASGTGRVSAGRCRCHCPSSHTRLLSDELLNGRVIHSASCTQTCRLEGRHAFFFSSFPCLPKRPLHRQCAQKEALDFWKYAGAADERH